MSKYGGELPFRLVVDLFGLKIAFIEYERNIKRELPLTVKEHDRGTVLRVYERKNIEKVLRHRYPNQEQSGKVDPKSESKTQQLIIVILIHYNTHILDSFFTNK